MKKIVFFIFVYLFSISFLDAGVNNLITNGDFEKGINNWQIFSEYELVKGYEGKKALCLNEIGYVESERIKVKGGNVYFVGGVCYVDNDEFNQSHIKVKWYNEKGEIIFWEFLTPLHLQNTWQEYYHKVFSPKGAVEASIVCYSHAFEAKSYFDNLIFEESTPNPDNIVLDYHFDNVNDYYMADYSGFGHYARGVYFDPEFYVATPSGRSIEFIEEVPLYFYTFRSESLNPRSNFKIEMVFWLDGLPENGIMNLVDYGVSGTDYNSLYRYKIFINEKGEIYFNLRTNKGICSVGGQLVSKTECHWVEAGYNQDKNEVYIRVRHAPQGGLPKIYQTNSISQLKVEERKKELKEEEKPVPAGIYNCLFIGRGGPYEHKKKVNNFLGVMERLRIYNN